MTRVPQAFGVVAAPRGHWDLVASGQSLEVLANSAAGPRRVRSIALPHTQALGVRLTPNGRYLLVADAQDGAVQARTSAGCRIRPGGLLSVTYRSGSRRSGSRW